MSRFTISLGLTLAAASPALAMTDQQFLKQAIQTDNAEIELGRLAEAKGGDVATKAYGQTLVLDHSQHKKEALAVAQHIGMAPPQDAPPAAKVENDKLERMSGVAFDKEFASFMIDGHARAIADFKTEAASGHGEVAKLAEKSLPTLQKHLAMARALQGGK